MSESGKGKLTFGLVLLLTGVILFLQLEGERNTGFGTLWPLYLILFGGIGLFGRGGKTFSGILLLAGLFFLLRNLNVLPYISGAYVWPALIILIGLAVIGSAFSRRKGGATTGGEGRYSAIFGEAADVINDPDFKSLSVNACFGSAQLDLSRADMRAEQAEIDVFAAFGGVELTLPQGWRVENRVLSILGGVDNKARPDGQEQKKVVLTGTVICGGITIRQR
jgi:predicted membrane protein